MNGRTAPKYFPLAYALVKPFLAEDTAAKVDVFSDGWKEPLKQDISETELPAHWGGMKRDPVDGDPRCPSLVCPGGEVPCSFYTAPVSTLFFLSLLHYVSRALIHLTGDLAGTVTSAFHRSKSASDNCGQALV